MSGEPVYVPRGGRERRLQRALLQYFKPENYADVREALGEADRLDLVGDGPECLIPARPPKIAAAPTRPSRAGRDSQGRLPPAPQNRQAAEAVEAFRVFLTLRVRLWRRFSPPFITKH